MRWMICCCWLAAFATIGLAQELPPAESRVEQEEPLVGQPPANEPPAPKPAEGAGPGGPLMGGPGMGPPGYRAAWYPSRPIVDSAERLGLVRQGLSVGAPIGKDDAHKVMLSTNIRQTTFFTDAILPDSGFRAFSSSSARERSREPPRRRRPREAGRRHCVPAEGM